MNQRQASLSLTSARCRNILEVEGALSLHGKRIILRTCTDSKLKRSQKIRDNASINNASEHTHSPFDASLLQKEAEGMGIEAGKIFFCKKKSAILEFTCDQMTFQNDERLTRSSWLISRSLAPKPLPGSLLLF